MLLQLMRQLVTSHHVTETGPQFMTVTELIHFGQVMSLPTDVMHHLDPFLNFTLLSSSQTTNTLSNLTPHPVFTSAQPPRQKFGSFSQPLFPFSEPTQFSAELFPLLPFLPSDLPLSVVKEPRFYLSHWPDPSTLKTKSRCLSLSARALHSPSWSSPTSPPIPSLILSSSNPVPAPFPSRPWHILFSQQLCLFIGWLFCIYQVSGHYTKIALLTVCSLVVLSTVLTQPILFQSI